MLPGPEGADPQRAATLALFHDSQETRTTDLDHVGRNYLHATPNEQITADQTAPLPRALASLLRGLVAEYEGRASLEAESPATPTSWRCCCRRWSTGSAATGTSSRSWRRRSRRCACPRGGGWGSAIQADPAAWWRAFARGPAPTERPAGGNGK
jgi:hypothetical protein